VFNKILNSLEEIVMASALAFMTILTFTNVVLRYLFGTSMIWQLQATTYAFAWLVVFGLSYCVRVNSHIAVDIFINKLSGNARRKAAIFAIGICVTYCGVMLFGSYERVEVLWRMGNLARDIPVPQWLLVSIMPIGFILLGYRFTEIGIQLIKGDLQSLASHNHKKENELLDDG
jgi:C4-dicarboxylate transporter DctQ subunit